MDSYLNQIFGGINKDFWWKIYSDIVGEHKTFDSLTQLQSALTHYIDTVYSAYETDLDKLYYVLNQVNSRLKKVLSYSVVKSDSELNHTLKLVDSYLQQKQNLVKAKLDNKLQKYYEIVDGFCAKLDNYPLATQIKIKKRITQKVRQLLSLPKIQNSYLLSSILEFFLKKCSF